MCCQVYTSKEIKIFSGSCNIYFFQSVALNGHTFTLVMKETRPPAASQSYFSGQLWGSVLKVLQRKIPLYYLETLWFVEEQDWFILSVLTKSSKGQCLWYERERVNMGQKGLRAPLAIGGGEGRSQDINKKYF